MLNYNERLIMTVDKITFAAIAPLIGGNPIGAEMAFGQMFARAIEGFIGVEYEDSPDEWEEAWDINEDWGISIARYI